MSAKEITAKAGAGDAVAHLDEPLIRRRPSAWYYFRGNLLAVIGLVVLTAMIIIAIAAPLVVPFDPDVISYDFSAPPSKEHPLGTDDVGRDVLSRLIYASRVSLSVGFAVSLLAVLLGSIAGSIAGYYGGRTDSLVSGGINVLLSIPLIPMAMVLGAFLKTDLLFVVLILGLLSWTGVARVIRAEFLSLKEREFVMAARLIGVSDLRIIRRHILPNVVAVVIVAATLMVATAILAESALSYLGYGIQPPTASWGNMLQNAQRFFRINPMMAIYPGILISITVICINFIGDGLRDALDPRLRN